MRFTKMHGAGNDYVYVNAWEETLPADLPAFARIVSHRHTGVGSDGLIVIGPSDLADARMRIWNADGSESGMCGNGLRCVAKYLYDRGIVSRDRLTIETGRGVMAATLDVSGGVVRSVRSSLGAPILRGVDVPTTLPGDPPLNVPLEVPPHRLLVTCVSMGNPHCVTFVDSLSGIDVASIGPRIESHPAFPERTNVGFAHVVSREEIELRVWERGSGETQACGSGACAALVAGVLTGRTSRRVLCRLPGGELDVEWLESGEVHLTGPAVESFRGELTQDAIGGGVSRARPLRRFVLLEHDHPILHWDLLVDEGESLRSWRLLSFPVPNQSIGAEPLPPHRRMYLDYEGPVSGNRGTVSRVDAGTCEMTIDAPAHQQVRLRGEQFRGTISIRPDKAAFTGWTAQFFPDNGSSAASPSSPSDS